MKQLLVPPAVAIAATFAAIFIGRLGGFDDQPIFHFASGYFVGIAFTRTYQFMQVRHG